MSTGTGLFVFLGGGFAKIFKQIVSIRVTKLSNTNLVALRKIKRNKVTLLAHVHHTKMSLFKLPITVNLRWRLMSNQDPEVKCLELMALATYW